MSTTGERTGGRWTLPCSCGHLSGKGDSWASGCSERGGSDVFWKDPGQEMVGTLSCPGNLTDHHAGLVGIFIPEENTPAF